MEVERGDADHECGGEHADYEADLLIEQGGAHDEAGLQILRRRAGDRRRDADDRADAQRNRRVVVANPTHRDEDRAGQNECRNGHPRNRIRRVADEAGDRDDTVTKKKPNRMIKIAARTLP